MTEPKKRRRIVPEAITSPTSKQKSSFNALNAPIIVDLKDQAEKGRKLGPGRKIYVNLAPFQNDHKQVNWRRLLNDQAVSNGYANANGDDAGVGDAGPLTAPPVPRRPLDAFLSAITRAMNVHMDDSSDSDDEYGPLAMNDDKDEGEDDDVGDDDDEENENDKEGDVNVDVNLEEGEKNEDETGTRKGTGDDKDQAKKKKMKRNNGYDYYDDWIDDSEFIEVTEFKDKRKSKHRGFVIYRGKIERDEAYNEAGYEYDEETGARQKKKRGGARASNKRRDAAGKGGGETPSGKLGKAKKEAPPYELPDDVREALERVEMVVKTIPESERLSQKRKIMPKQVREELIRSETVFKPEIDKVGPTAQKAIVDHLMKFVAVFTSRQNINAYVTGRMGGTLRQDLVFSADIVKEIVKDLKPVAHKADDKPVFESEDAFLKHIPLVLLAKVAKQIRLGLQGDTLKSDRGTAVLEEVLGCFPEGTMELESLSKVLEEVEKTEKKAELESKQTKKLREDQDKGGKAVEEMGVQVNDLDVDTAVEKGLAQGADADGLRALLESEEAKNDENWSCSLRLLAVAGPYGLKIKFIGTTGQSSGLLKKGKDLHIRTVASKITRLFNENSSIVGKIKDTNGYYALRVFPGVEFEEPLHRTPGKKTQDASTIDSDRVPSDAQTVTADDVADEIELDLDGLDDDVSP